MNLQREQRVDRILLSLKNLDYLSTSQLQRLHNLGGDRNTRRFMQSMNDLVSSFRDTENVYYLNKSGRERIGSTIVRQKISPVTHYLMRNDVFIQRKPEIFEPEMKITVGNTTVIPDVWMRHNGAYYFVEIDNTQRMVKNTQKLERYKKLKESGAFQQKYGYFPRILWVTALASRQKVLADMFNEFETIVQLWEEIN